MTARELVFMSADDGTVVALSEATGAPHAAVFLTTEETLWVSEPPGGTPFEERGGGVSQVRLSTMAELVTGAVHAVRERPGRAAQVPVNLAVTLEPAALVYPSPLDVRPVRVTGWLTVGSVLRDVRGTGWLSAAPAEGLPGCRARVVFQDGSGVFVADGDAGGVTAVAVAGVASRLVAAERVLLEDTGRGPAYRVRYRLGGRRPATVSAEIRYVEQHLTFVEPATDGDGWLSWSGTPAVFVRSGLTGLGLVERCARVASPEAAPVPVGLPDPY